MLKQTQYLFQFLVNPEKVQPSIKREYSIIFKMVGLYFLAMLFYIFILKFTDRYLGLPPHRVFEIIKGNSIPKIILHGAIIAPIFEELAFRLPLRYSRRNLSISLIAILFYFNLYTINISIFYLMAFSIPLALAFYYTVGKNHNLDRTMEKWWQHNNRSIIWLSILLFGLMHTRNYHSLENMLVLPILIFPQLFLGLIFSFLRCRYTIFHSILTHFFINALLLSLVLLALKGA